MKNILPLFVIVVSLSLLFPPPANAQTAITLNPSSTFQTITGWEATSYAKQDDPNYPNFQNDLIDKTANELGITRVRLEIQSGHENTLDNWLLYDNGNGSLPYATYRCRRYSTVNDNNDPNLINPAGFHFSQLDFMVDNVITPLKTKVEANGEQLFINLNYVAFTEQMRASGCEPGLQYHHSDPREYAEFILVTVQHLQTKYGLAPATV